MSSFIPLYNAIHWRKLKNHDDEDLPQEDVLKLWGFFNMIKWTRGCSFVMRGESNENLMDQFGTDADHPDLLAKYLFMLGEKGRICWENKSYLDPDDTREANFEAICKALARYIKEQSIVMIIRKSRAMCQLPQIGMLPKIMLWMCVFMVGCLKW